MGECEKNEVAFYRELAKRLNKEKQQLLQANQRLSDENKVLKKQLRTQREYMKKKHQEVK